MVAAVPVDPRYITPMLWMVIALLRVMSRELRILRRAVRALHRPGAGDCGIPKAHGGVVAVPVAYAAWTYM